jgi:hypothetical protein
LRANSATALVLLGAAVLAAGARVSAHRQDEYLHAARIAIEPSGVRVELSLTPGIAVADAVIRDIDVNGDGGLSPAEQRVYAEHVLRGVSLLLDGRPVPLALSNASCAEPAALRAGSGAITLEADARRLRLAAGTHTISFRNANTVHGAVYLANALMPADARVAITKLAHAMDQSGLTVAFTLRPARSWL